MARRRPKKRPPKDVRALRVHSARSAALRYGICLDEDERRDKILTEIRSGRQSPECRCIERQSLRRTLWRIEIDGQVVGVIYDSHHKELVTFIPPEDPRLNAEG